MRKGGAWAELLTYWVPVDATRRLTTNAGGARANTAAPQGPPFLTAVPLAEDACISARPHTPRPFLDSRFSRDLRN